MTRTERFFYRATFWIPPAPLRDVFGHSRLLIFVFVLLTVIATVSYRWHGLLNHHEAGVFLLSTLHRRAHPPLVVEVLGNVEERVQRYHGIAWVGGAEENRVLSEHSSSSSPRPPLP